MKRCPITYESIPENQLYSEQGLKLLSTKITHLDRLNYSAAEQRAEAIAHAGKMSVQGVQPKLSAILRITKGQFEIVDQHGKFILKPQNEHYLQLPENEALTMSLAKIINIDVPLHGLLYSKDNSMTYFIKRFDRIGRDKKIAVEDFAQLSQLSRDTKYDSSMEKVIKVIKDYCSFPKIELAKLFKLTLFNFLIGNEDMHLKNFSLIVRDNKVTLSPAYDLLNTTIAQQNTKEELALPLNGKRNNLKKKDFLDYFAEQQLQLNKNIIGKILTDIQDAKPQWLELISHSFLSADMQKKYLALLNERLQRLELD